MDAGSRHKIPGSETKDFISQSSTGVSGLFASVPHAPPTPTGATQKVHDGCLHMQWVALQERITEHGESIACIVKWKQACSWGRNMLHLWRLLTSNTTLTSDPRKSGPCPAFLAYPARTCRDTQGLWWLPLPTVTTKLSQAFVGHKFLSFCNIS